MSSIYFQMYLCTHGAKAVAPVYKVAPQDRYPLIIGPMR